MPFFGLNNSRRRPPYVHANHTAYHNIHGMYRTIRDLQSQVHDLQSGARDLQLKAQSTEKFIVTTGNHIEKVENTSVIDIFKGNPTLQQIGTSDSSFRIGHFTHDLVEPKNSKNVTVGTLANGGITVPSLANGSITTPFSGTRNVVVGHIAHGKATTASKNCVVGHNGAFENITGSANTVLGYGAMWDNTQGDNNTAVGASAGNNTIGNNNTFLGVKAGRINGLQAEDYLKYNYTTCLGVGSFASGDNQVVLGRPLVDNVRGGNYYNCADERDISIISEDESEMLGLDFISKLNPITYTYKNRDTNVADDGPVHYGLIAQDVKSVLGSIDTAIVNISKDQQLLCYSELIAPMIKSIQDLNTKISGFETTISGLKEEISALKGENTQLEAI